MAATSESKTFHCEIVAPDRKVFSGEIEFGVFPGTEGELGILPRHAPLLSKLSPGIIKIVQKGMPTSFATYGGFLDVNNNKATVVAETCEAAADIDKEACIAERKTAEAEIAENKSPTAVTAARLRLKYVQAKIKVAGKEFTQSESGH